MHDCSARRVQCGGGAGEDVVEMDTGVRGAEVREPWLRQAEDVAAMLATDVRTG